MISKKMLKTVLEMKTVHTCTCTVNVTYFQDWLKLMNGICTGLALVVKFPVVQATCIVNFRKYLGLQGKFSSQNDTFSVILTFAKFIKAHLFSVNTRGAIFTTILEW